MFYLPVYLALTASLALAANEGDVAFLTALVTDFKANPKSYIDFLATANPPAELTLLAFQVQTYTDDSYTTLLDDSNVDVGELKSFALKLPWALRLDTGNGGGGDAPAKTEDSNGDGAAGAGVTEAPKESKSKDDDKTKNDDKTKDDDKKSTQSPLESVLSQADVALMSVNSVNSENSHNGAAGAYAPYGVAVGAVALLLM